MRNQKIEAILPSSWIFLILLVVFGPFLGHLERQAPVSSPQVWGTEAPRLDAYTPPHDMPVLVSQGLPSVSSGRLVTPADPRKQDSQPFFASVAPEQVKTPSVGMELLTPAFWTMPDIWPGFVCASRSPPLLG